MNRMMKLVVLMAVLIFGESIGLIYFAQRAQNEQAKLKNLELGFVASQEDKAALESLEKEKNTLQSQFNELVKENTAIKEDRNNLLAQIKNLLGEKNRATALEESLQKAQGDIKILEREKQDIQQEKLNLNAEIEKLNEEKAGVVAERDQLRVAYEKAKKEELVKELNQQIAKLEKEKKVLTDQFEKEKKNLIANLEKDKDNLENNIKSQQEEFQMLKQKYSASETEKEDLKREIREYKTGLAEAADKNKRLEKEIQNTPKKFAEIARQNRMLIKETAEMHYNLGIFYTKFKEYNRAIAEFEKVVDIDPNDAYAHFNLGYIYAEYLVNRQRAIEHFRHYLRLAKSDDKDVDWVKKYLLTWETFEGKKPLE